MKDGNKANRRWMVTLALTCARKRSPTVYARWRRFPRVGQENKRNKSQTVYRLKTWCFSFVFYYFNIIRGKTNLKQNTRFYLFPITNWHEKTKSFVLHACNRFSLFLCQRVFQLISLRLIFFTELSWSGCFSHIYIPISLKIDFPPLSNYSFFPPK